jgi:DNA-binding NarL/FixJ family response regulator
MAKKYVVDLNEAELSQLRSLTKTGKHKARTITRANILIMASEGYSDNAIASTLRVNVSTVERKNVKNLWLVRLNMRLKTVHIHQSLANLMVSKKHF